MVAYTFSSITFGGGRSRRVSAGAGCVGTRKGDHERCERLGGEFAMARP